MSAPKIPKEFGPNSIFADDICKVSADTAAPEGLSVYTCPIRQNNRGCQDKFNVPLLRSHGRVETRWRDWGGNVTAVGCSLGLIVSKGIRHSSSCLLSPPFGLSCARYSNVAIES